MPYTGNPSTDTSDAVRLLIYDTSTSSGSNALQDKEITYFIQQEVNVLYAAAAAAETIGGKFSGDSAASMTQVGDLQLQVGSGDPASAYRALADTLRMRANLSLKPFSGGISKSEKRAQDADPDYDQPAVKLGIFDNPSGGASTGDF